MGVLGGVWVEVLVGAGVRDWAMAWGMVVAGAVSGCIVWRVAVAWAVFLLVLRG